MMTSLLLKNAHIVDGTAPERSDRVNVLIENGVVRDVGKTVSATSDNVIDVAGRTLMPGLIDCHVHVIAVVASLGANAKLPDSLVAARSIAVMRDMLHRGFTTVRDVGGADFGLKQAASEGLFQAPRLVISGKALSQTGGHCDFRGRYDDTPTPRSRIPLGSLGRVCDGVPDVRRAAREEVKAGADFIKIMANGGCASPTDPIHFQGFSREELDAVVEEARNAGTYVSAHLYTDDAIRRCVDAGVRSLEHCNLIKSATARLAAESGCIAVPTLVTYERLASEGASLGVPQESIAKVEDVRSAGMESLGIMRDAGLPMAYGTDLLGEMHRHQSEEFVIRGRMLPAQTIIASTTGVAAKLLGMEGLIGTIAPGAFADMIVVDGDPLTNLSLLTQQGAHMALIMQAGRLIKNTLPR
jgi:imidazolonepropionase-like amidohydrolase